MTERAKLAVSGAKTALDKIRVMLELMADDLVTSQESVRLMAQFDAIYAREWPVERLLTLEAQVCPGVFQQFTALVREGIAEGSLRSDLNPSLTLHAVRNAVVGAQRRLASLRSRVELEYGHPIDSLFRETIRILLLGMRAT